MWGTGKSCICPVLGSSLVILFAAPKFGIHMLPSLSGAALNGIRLGPGMSYSTYTMFIASLLKGERCPCIPGMSAGDFGSDGIGTEQAGQIGGNIVRVLIAEAVHVEVHRGAHVLDAILPAILVAPSPKPCGFEIRGR